MSGRVECGKKPRRAEVDYCPQHPKGEMTDTLEYERIALLSEIKKKNNGHMVTEKMENTLSYRRQETAAGESLVRCQTLSAVLL